MGGIAQPLFSAFGEDSLRTRLHDAPTSAVFTQRKHAAEVRSIREDLPTLGRIVLVDAADANLRPGECGFKLDALPRADRIELFPATADTPSVLHSTSGTTGQPKGALHVRGSIVAQ